MHRTEQPTRSDTVGQEAAIDEKVDFKSNMTPRLLANMIFAWSGVLLASTVIDYLR